jgi:hypothetical protein
MHGVDWVTLGWGIWGTKNVTFNAKRPAHKIIKVSTENSQNVVTWRIRL